MVNKAHIIYDIKVLDKAGFHKNDIIVTTCEKVYNKLISEGLYVKYINLNTYISKKKSIAGYMKSVNKILNIIKFDNIDMVLPNINTLYRNWYYIIDFFLEEIRGIVEGNNIEEIYIYGGNPKISFITLTLAEGEKTKVFLYKRQWFFNVFIYNQYIDSKVNIIWLNKNNYYFIKILREIRIQIIFYAKLFVTLLSTVSNSSNKSSNQNISNYNTMFLVRNPMQVEPLEGIYKEMKKVGRNPVFAFSKAYFKRGVGKELEHRNLESFNMDSLISIKDILDSKNILKNNLRELEDELISIFKVDYYTKDIIKEISLYIFDEILRLKTFKKYIETFGIEEDCIFINNETYNYRAAIDSLWAKANRYLIFSIQHVAMEASLKPIMIWQDSMYMMTLDIAEKLNDISGMDKFKFLGPGSYDSVYNTSLSKSRLNNISIFTQADGLSEDYMEIIDDLIGIRKKLELNFEIKVKLHPREINRDKYTNKYRGVEFLKIASDEENTNIIIQNSDLAISIYSGTIFQSIIIGTPIISVNYNKKHKYITDYIQSDVTEKVNSKKEFFEKIANFNSVRSKYLMNRRLYLSNNLCAYNGDSNKKIARSILEYRKE